MAMYSSSVISSRNRLEGRIVIKYMKQEANIMTG